MSKRVANRSGPSRNKAGRNAQRKTLRRLLTQAKTAQDVSWFTKIMYRLKSIAK